MFRKDIPKFLTEQKNSIIYIGSSNKNIDMYFDNIREKENVIKLSDIQEEDEYYRINYELIEKIKENKKLIIFTSLEGVLKEYFFENESLKLFLGLSISRKKLINILEKNNFKKKYLVQDRMEFSVRGDIIDIFPLSGAFPIRIEYFGDEIDRITYFSSSDQKSLEKINSVNIYVNESNSKKLNFYELIEKLKEKTSYDIFIENYEVLQYKFEGAILRERDKELILKELYNQINDISIKIDVFKSENDIGKVKKYNSKNGVSYENISQIKEGDYIIHENYGVGIFLEISQINGDEYLAIKYADEDKLFVPIESLNKIEKFLTSSGKVPELYNLGRRGFKKRREKLEEDMLKFAKEIVQIQARRSLKNGYKFSADTVWQEEFEEQFSYTETRDQKNAIEDVKRDMESSKVMDRIVCGDVGYGKTEVAIRSVFKCVMDGKQALIIAPTTVLAQQHFDVFKERYKDYPITLELLSRSISDKDQKDIIEKFAKGSIDIIIGTHRVLSGDLKAQNLGLIIVDEEQKFGVKDKEKLKKIKQNVDMLTLTATPIPRTLNYALLGIRDLSVIETPPSGRLPIETIFLSNPQKDIKEAVMKEISREGQVFYIFNRVKRIEDKLTELKKILPKFVTIDYIHGQMLSKDIKDKLKNFQEGNIDVLLSTTIIENGIDIENANTIIIEGIDKLGLSQIYQLRGRVGRGKRKGYCYLVLDVEKKISKKVAERNNTLKELGDFGGGFKLSIEDMKIRGAGEILGDKQHGALEMFGYNLYTKLLQEEISKIKGDYKEEFETKIDLKEEAYISKDYIENDERLVIYRRLINIKNVISLKDLKIEIADRFGFLPKETNNLFKYLEVKLLAEELKIKEIKKLNDEYFYKFDNKYVNFEKLMKIINKKEARYSQKDDGIYSNKDILDFLNWYKEEEK
ncbi:MAG: DEAD/DEAH box helicase [Cetobacterium sp.]